MLFQMLLVFSAAAQTPTFSVTPDGQSPTPSSILANDLQQVVQSMQTRTQLTVNRPVWYENQAAIVSRQSSAKKKKSHDAPVSIFLQPDLTTYTQQELFEEYRRSGKFDVVMSRESYIPPATPSRSWRVVHDIKSVPYRDQYGRLHSTTVVSPPLPAPKPSATSPRYYMVSAVGILEESFDSKTRTREVTGVLYVAIMGRVRDRYEVLKSQTGVASVLYTVPKKKKDDTRFIGSGKFARDLVLAALYDPVDRGQSLEKFLARRKDAALQLKHR